MPIIDHYRSPFCQDKVVGKRQEQGGKDRAPVEGVSVAGFGVRMLPQLAGDGDEAIAQ